MNIRRSSIFHKDRILVTGGTGFLGQYVVEALKSKEAQVHSADSIDADLRDASDINYLFADIRPTIVIHLAANVGGIGANADHPAEFYTDNVLMNTLVLDYAYHYGVEKFVALGSICAYPKFTPVPFREESLWDGYPEETNAPYGLAKRMLLVQCQAYRKQHGFNAIYLMPTNLYGPKDNFNPETSHVIPALIEKFVHATRYNEPSVTLWGDGTPTRDFLHVRDAARGIVVAAEYYDSPDPINLGSGNEISIGLLADAIAFQIGFKGLIYWDKSKPNGQPRRVLDTSKAKQAFGFEASIPLVDGLKETIDWYKEAVKI